MKHTYMNNGVGGRCLAFFTALSLCACSVLQIDVDEYKGPMANHEDIQLRQYIALATSAKPIIVALRNNYIWDDQSYASYGNTAKTADRDCLKDNKNISDEYIGCTLQLNIAYFLNSILALYEDTDTLKTKVTAYQSPKTTEKNTPDNYRKQKTNLPAEDKARDALGITELTKRFIDATEKANDLQNESTLNNLRIAKERLNGSLIIFAEKILYTVNNHQLANGSANEESFARKLAVLQSLGNTLIVHADDLRKRATHDQRLKDRKNSELTAAQHAFAPGAQNAFDNLVRDLEVAVRQKGSTELSLERAIGEFNKMPITEKDISDSEKKLKADAEKVQPNLNAYRTAFDDYKLDAEGITPADSSVDEDRREIADLFKPVNRVTMGDVFTKLESWFDESKIMPQGELPSADPKYNRRNCAKTAFDKFKSKLFIQDFEVVGAETELFKKLGGRFLVKLDEDKLSLKKTQKEIADKKQAFEKNEENIKEKEKVAGVKGQLEKTLKTIKSIKQEVLQEAENAKVVDLSGLRHLLLLEIKKQSLLEATEAKKKEEFQIAGDMLAAMSIPKTFQFSGGSQVKTQRDVLDDVIAQLQQQRLEAASRGGDITALNKALELAYEQRGGLAYLRPASAYLRNAFSNTSVQDSSGSTNCYNLLLPLFCNDIATRAIRDTKVEIDKQFWQTINTIKVRGGGATDFAIVKDDVGNWYVKGLSSDPESIIKSAQSLALFNMGGKVNLNLLGQVETRRKLAKLDISSSDRQTLKDELREQQSGSGANTAGLEKVLDKYRKEYVDATTMDVNSLIGKLDQLPTDIDAAWQDINFGEAKDASLKSLKALLGSPSELVTAKSALNSAKTDLDKTGPQASATTPKIPAVTETDAAKTTPPAAQDSSTAKALSEATNIKASNAIVKSLTEVRNMRSRLMKAIIQNDDLIATQRSGHDAAEAAFNAQNVIATGRKDEWEKANTKVISAQASYDDLTTPAAVLKKREALTAAEQTLKVKQDDLNKAHAAQETEVAGKRATWSKAVEDRKTAQTKANAPTASAADKAEFTRLEDALAIAEKSLDSAINIPSVDVTAKTAARDKAENDRKFEQGIFDSLTAPTASNSAKANLDKAKGELDTAKTNLDAANTILTAKSALTKTADNTYTLAKSNRLAAARKVSALANSLIETTTANRLEAVKAYEVAIGFVGQTAGGQ